MPRSVSEFNLSGVGDLALPPPRRCSPTGMGLPHGLQLGPPQTLICGPPPPQVQIVMKPREKMVTFEDESKGMVPGMANTSAVGTTCPHGVPTTPRKSNPAGHGVGGGGGGGGADVFM